MARAIFRGAHKRVLIATLSLPSQAKVSGRNGDQFSFQAFCCGLNLSGERRDCMMEHVGLIAVDNPIAGVQHLKPHGVGRTVEK